MDSMDNFRERFEALERQTEQLKHETQALKAQTYTVERQLRWCLTRERRHRRHKDARDQERCCPTMCRHHRVTAYCAVDPELVVAGAFLLSTSAWYSSSVM